MDIVERLRNAQSNEWNGLMMELAADEIERLRETLRVEIEGSMHAWEERMKFYDENKRLREALKRIGDGDTCMGLMTHPPICKRAYDARAALKEGE